MTSRPLAVLGAGVATLAVAVLHATTAYRRNTVSHQTYAVLTTPSPTERMLTTDKTVEWNDTLPIDEVSPDSLSYTVRKGIDVLLNQTTARGIALDWASFHSHVFDNPEHGVAQVIIRLDVLS